MIKYLNKKNNYDFIHKFQWINVNNKPKLNILLIDNNNNNIINKNNLIYPTYYSLLLLFNQKPYIKTTKKSIASFNIRPNMNLGGYITINNKSLFWNKLFYFINPSLSIYKNNITYQYSKNKYNIHKNYGIKNLNNKNYNYTPRVYNIGGANLIFKLESPVKYIPFYYLP